MFDVSTVKSGDVIGGKTVKFVHNRAAEGEVTGHAHRCLDGNATVLEFTDGSRELHVTGERASLTHEEHKPVSIDYGQYEVRIVQEQDPLEDYVRNVAD